MRSGSFTSLARRMAAHAWVANSCMLALLFAASSHVAVADGDVGIPRLVALQQDASPDKALKKGVEKSADRTTKKVVAKPQNKSLDAVKPKTGAGSISPEKEAAVRQFVDQHHAELAVLLNHLKDNNSQEYDRAMRDLYRVAERLSQARDKDQRRYELDLKQWQNQSRIDLLTARLKMANSEDYREPMRILLRERLEIKTALLQLERERLAERLQKTDQHLHTLGVEQDALVDNQLRVILGSNKPAKPVRPAGNAKKNSSK